MLSVLGDFVLKDDDRREDSVFSGLKIPDRVLHFARVGVVSSKWAVFEYLVDVKAIELAGLNVSLALCFTSQVIGPSRKMDAYTSIAGQVGVSDPIKKLGKFRSRVDSLAEKRNRILHDPWSFVDGDDAYRIQITAKKNLIVDFVDVDAGEIMSISSAIGDLTEDFLKIHESFMMERK